MKKILHRVLLISSCLLLAGGGVACTDDATETKEKFQVTDFESSTVPEDIPYNGGIYKVLLKTSILTRAASPTFVEWQYRVTIGSAVGQAVVVTTPTTSIDIEIDPNYTDAERSVIVEMAQAAPSPEWTKIVEATQASALMLVGDYYWAKGNVTLKDGKFAIAEKMSDVGLYFRNGSKYGVPSDGNYAGTAYMPEPVQIALADIPYGELDVDPCTMIDSKLRTPSYRELDALYNVEKFQNGQQLDGISVMGYENSTFVIPYCGAISILTGQLSGRSQFVGYWGLGSNYDNQGVIYALVAGSEGYSIVDYDLTSENMGVLRCVKNIRKPSYVRHTPEVITDNEAVRITVTTDPGDFSTYDVELEANDGAYTQTEATQSHSEVNLTIPKNDEPTECHWKIFVNRVYTGVSFVQPGLKNYVRYASHSPARSSAEAFTLTVRCESDLASFPVAIKGPDGFEQTQTGSKDNLTLSFQIPANDGAERKFAIWVNDTNTGKTVTQEANPNFGLFSVTWSSGYLTIENGEYVFAQPKERGMYFKWKSKYGIKFDGAISSSTKYQGTVYAPAEQSIPQYTDIPYGDVDPCSLVAPAGTWYMPTAAMLQELVAEGSKEFEASVFRMCSDGQQNVYLGVSGQLFKDGTKTMLPTIISVWSTTESTTKPGQYCYLMWATSSASSNGSLSATGVDPHTATMVRCVRNK